MEIDDNMLIKTKEVLASKLFDYVSIIRQEYSKIIPPEYLLYLDSVKDYNSIIKIEETGTISMFVKNGIVYFPISAFSIINILKKIPGYGVNKYHQTYTSENLILNDNSYLDYIIHVFISGLTTLQFYEETLLHETTHLCGIRGATALREGFAELKTRELAQKYDLKTSACGYPKEVRIAFDLQSIFGKEIGDRIAFARSNDEILSLLELNYGKDASDFYLLLENEMQSKFMSYCSKKYPGVMGPLQKSREYDKVDYSRAYEIIDGYKKTIAFNHIK